MRFFCEEYFSSLMI